MQNRVFHGIKNDLDVLRIDRRREMMIKRLFCIPADAGEHREYKRLYVLHGMRIASKLRKVPTYIGLGIGHFLLQQVVLVEEENDRNVTKDDIVDDRVEDVARLLKPVGLSIFEKDLVELRGGDQEEYRRDRIEALEPFLSLRSLPADIDKQKGDVVDGYHEFRYAFGCLPAMEDVFVGGDVVRPGYPVQVVEEIFYGVALQQKIVKMQ